MASNYPTSLDTFTNPTSNDSLNSPSHSLQHADINDAVEAIEAKLGIGASSAGSATSGYVLTAGTGGTTTWSAPSIAGLTQIVPTSIVKGASGSASVSSGGAVTFSGTESISLNGVFTATYDNYFWQCEIVGSTGSDAAFRLRSSGTDASGSNYNWQYLFVGSTTVSGARSTSQTSTRFMYSNTSKSIANIWIFSPFKSEVTTYKSHSGTQASGTLTEILDYTGGHTLTNSYDGFSVFPASGTFTGTIRVYGYRNG